MTDLSPAEQLMLNAYYLAESDFIAMQSSLNNDQLAAPLDSDQLSDWRKANSSAQALYELCISAGLDPAVGRP